MQFDASSMHAKAQAEIQKMPDGGNGSVEVRFV